MSILGKQNFGTETWNITGNNSDVVLQNAIDTSTRNIIYVRNYGVVSSDTIDATEAVRLAHAAANAANARVSYDGLAIVCIQANARIALQTSTDFAYCKIRPLNAVNTGTLTYSGYQMFVVTDPAAPLVTLLNQTPTSVSTSLMKGSVTPTRGIFEGSGFVNIVHSSVTVPGRAAPTISTTISYRQSFWANKGGLTTSALATDLTANGGLLATVSYRKSSDRRLTIEHFTTAEYGYNNQTFFAIARNNVDLRYLNVTDTEETPSFANINQLVLIENCGDIVISDYRVSPRMTIGTQGTYGLNITNAADIYLNRMLSTGRAIDGGSAWGTIGTNNVNGFYITDCILNRVDCHSGGFNFFVHDCILSGPSGGVIYGWGGGTLSVKNTKVYGGISLVSKRSDYSGSWFGEIVVSDCELSAPGTQTAFGVRIQNIGAHVDTFCPEAIRVSNIVRVDRSSGNGGPFVPIELTVSSVASYQSALVYPPQNIVVDNVSSLTDQWRSNILIDYMNMAAIPTRQFMDISVSGIHPNLLTSGTSLSGFYDNPLQAGRTLTAFSYPTRVVIRIQDCSRFYVRSRLVNSSSGTSRQLYINNSGLCGVELDQASGNPLTCVITNCRFDDAVPAVGTAVIGSVYSSPTRFTTITNCYFSTLSPWDISGASVLYGNVLATGHSVVLPSGCTPHTAFSGFYSTSSVGNGPKVVTDMSLVSSDYTLRWPAATGGLHQSLGIGATAGTLAWSSTPVVRACSNTQVTSAAVTTEEVLYSAAIPANSLGPNGCAFVSFVIRSANTTATSRMLRVRVSSAATGGSQVYSNAFGASNTTFALNRYLVANNNSVSAQKSPASANVGFSTSGLNTAAVDTAGGILYINLTYQTDNVASLATLEHVLVETIYSL
jgi:hypothetical protein